MRDRIENTSWNMRAFPSPSLSVCQGVREGQSIWWRLREGGGGEMDPPKKQKREAVLTFGAGEGGEVATSRAETVDCMRQA